MKHIRFFSGAVLFLISSFGLVLIGNAQSAAKTAANKTGVKAQRVQAKTTGRQGYSIFRETMVEMSWPEVQRAAEADALVILPVGVIEEHGPHMGLGADTYLAYQACRMLKDRLAKDNIQAVIVPPVYWGVMQTDETGKYPGSFTVQPSTMKALLVDILADLQRWGFRHVFPASLHGDRVHRQTFRDAMAEGREKLGLDIYDAKVQGEERPHVSPYKVEKPFEPDYHAGAMETSEMLRVFPEEVNLQVAQALRPEGSFHPLGYVGDPANHANANPTLPALVEPVAASVKKWLKNSEKKNQ